MLNAAAGGHNLIMGGPPGAGKTLLKAAMQQPGMSARAYHRILNLARTVADPSASSGQALRLCSGQAWRVAKGLGQAHSFNGYVDALVTGQAGNLLQHILPG
jgi:hypothetical protein